MKKLILILALENWQEFSLTLVGSIRFPLASAREENRLEKPKTKFQIFEISSEEKLIVWTKKHDFDINMIF